ncbi:hypothetical protein PENVUL_c005G03085 [Penicillium vulpinum]|uniref:Uncharacterized protein n=1 Tax=Penicillium vulpinum TaxID=29845 RepID=A0A1V6S800_9EURO|nr:hypothetical protein PENVUL_c005G03085 [Penicillium vulpinum]
MPKSKSKSNPLTSPATPIALHPHHLLSPPPDLLTNTATTLTITTTQETKSPSPIFTVHRTRPHEAPDTPDRNVLLYNVFGKPWPNTSRIVCDAEGMPLLVLRRVWLSSVRKWSVRFPDQNQGDLLVASMPWAGGGDGARVGVGSGGFRLEVRFVNALVIRSVGSGGVRSGSRLGVAIPDDPPPYSAVSGVGGEERHPHSHPVLPSYASVRRDSPNSLRDLLDAIEPPQEPAPASPFLSSASASQNPNPSTSTSPVPGLDAEADAPPGPKVELRVMQLAGSDTGIMMGNQQIMNITRRNVIDYSKSKVKSRPRWEVEVSEGVDLLLAVNIVLIMADSVSSQNRWR